MTSTPVNPEFVERYQLEYQKNPRSKVFAPLAEAYRKMGLLEEAFTVAQAGVKHHPSFASGRVVFARILLDQKNFEQALDHLKAAATLSPDNIMAHSLMGETFLQLRRPKDALNAFKMVLFIDPGNERARLAVRKWEFLTADEYEDELFNVGPAVKKRFSTDEADGAGPEILAPVGTRESGSARELDRALSLADAFTVRNETEKAYQVLLAARNKVGPSEELGNRLALLARRLGRTEGAAVPVGAPRTKSLDRRLKLELFLRRISERRLDR